MMISQTSSPPPYSFLDWFKKDIAVTLIKYGYELDTALLVTGYLLLGYIC